MTIKTLLIEDDPALANLSKLRLQRLDMEVFHAADGIQAMDYLDENQPNLILLDINIPMIDGWGVLEAAKNRYGQTFKVIVTSARRDIISRAKGEIEGVDRYLVKPFTSEELIETIQSVMDEAGE